MAYSKSLPHLPARLTFDGFSTMVSERLQAFRESRAKAAIYRTSVRELQNLSDRELSDLGIARCDIARIARDSVYPK